MSPPAYLQRVNNLPHLILLDNYLYSYNIPDPDFNPNFSSHVILQDNDMHQNYHYHTRNKNSYVHQIYYLSKVDNQLNMLQHHIINLVTNIFTGKE